MAVRWMAAMAAAPVGMLAWMATSLIVTPFHEIHDAEPRTTGNHGTSKRAEKAAIKKLLSSSRYLLPVHDRPAKIEGGMVVGRLHDQVPGPVVQSLPQRNWFPA